MMRLRPLLPARRAFLALAVLVLAAGCATGTAERPRTGTAESARPASWRPSAREQAFLDTLERRTFEWFHDLSDPRTGLTPDRWPTRSFTSTAADGFALTAWPIGVARGWMSRDEAVTRTLNTLRWFRDAPQGEARAGMTGHRGFYYHFLEPGTGTRFGEVELSTMDTALLMAGVLFCQSWFDREDPREAEIRALADTLYRRVDWRWAQVRPPAISLGWHPESGHLPYDYRGYSETMLLYILALGSPTHPVEPAAWAEYCRGYRWGSFHGEEHIGFAPLFGHHYSHCWIDFRGIRDAYMRDKGIDYAENSRRATYAQRAYALANPGGFTGYGEGLWGLTACDGPVDAELEIRGRKRAFRTYAARGASFTEVVDDGTVAPTAAAGSVAFAPEIVVPVLVAMRERYGPDLFSDYGFLDALNPTLDVETRVQHGRVVAGKGWFDTDYLGIDQGPILLMLENHRSGLVWETMKRNPHVVRGLRAAGFEGGWLAPAGAR
jgi:hypothetical protein